MSLLFKRAIALPAIATLCVVTVSCGESKVSQCNRMIDVVNKAVTEIETTTANVTEGDTSAMTKIADTADKAAESMKTLEFTDEKLKGYQERFLTMYTEVSKASRDLVTASENDDADAGGKAYDSLKSSTDKESPLVDEMNAYCGGK